MVSLTRPCDILTGRVADLMNQTDVVIQIDIMIDKGISFWLMKQIVEGFPFVYLNGTQALPLLKAGYNRNS